MSCWRRLGIALFVAHLFSAAARAAELNVLTHALPPFTMGNATALSGMAVETVQAIMRRTGDTGVLTLEPFPRLLQDVKAGPMTVGFIVARTPAREALLQWVGPVAVTGVYFYKRAGSPLQLTSLEDARHLESIGVTREDSDHRFLVEHHFTNLQISESQVVNLQQLKLGRVDATPMGEMAFTAALGQAGLKAEDFEKTDLKLYDSRVYIAFSPDVPGSVTAAWSSALKDFKESAEYKALLVRYRLSAVTAGDTTQG